MVKGIPVRIQKAGTEDHFCHDRVKDPVGDEPAKPVSMPKAPAAESVKRGEPKVEIREVGPGIFEITMTCGCGQQSIVRCESLMPSSSVSGSGA